MGSLVPAKGVEVLLAAVARLADAELVLVGSGPRGSLRRVERLAARLRLGNRVVVRGPLPPASVAGEMARASVLALPSFMETSPNVVSEAMCAGLPVVATRVGGIPDMVTHGETGWLVRPGDAADLAAGLDRVLADAEAARRMAARARAVALVRHDAGSVAGRTRAAYAAVLQGDSEGMMLRMHVVFHRSHACSTGWTRDDGGQRQPPVRLERTTAGKSRNFILPVSMTWFPQGV